MESLTQKVMFSRDSTEWGTPLELYHKLDQEFGFTLDPCTTEDNPLQVKSFLTIEDDGLRYSWRGHHVYCNPPYGRGVGKWLAKALEADLAVYLLPARTDTLWFHTYCWPIGSLKTQEIRFLKGRLTFRGAPAPAPFPSMLVIFRNE